MPARGRHRLGAHMSIGGGLDRAIDRAHSVDATALQVLIRAVTLVVIAARPWVAWIYNSSTPRNTLKMLRRSLSQG